MLVAKLDDLYWLVTECKKLKIRALQHNRTETKQNKYQKSFQIDSCYQNTCRWVFKDFKKFRVIATLIIEIVLITIALFAMSHYELFIFRFALQVPTNTNDS